MKKTSYIDNVFDWRKSLKDRHLLFDTSAVINIINFKATDLIEEMKAINVDLNTIEPVFIELLATDNTTRSLERQSFVIENKFTFLPLVKRNFDEARILQAELRKLQCFPGPTDLYLGCILEQYKPSGMLLITCDHKDFPEPKYTRIGQIILCNSKSFCVLSILKS